MGMSASQARYLSLTERMNDIEYQGQQINQQRTTLSNQVNALYNSLLEMNVPTPPSTKDYQKTIYQGSLGATKYTVDSTDIVPKADNKYSITLGMKGHGGTVEKSTGYANVSNVGAAINGVAPEWETIAASSLTAASGLSETAAGKVQARVEKINNPSKDNLADGEFYIKKDGLYFSRKPEDFITSVDAKEGSYRVYEYSGSATMAEINASGKDYEGNPVPTGKTTTVTVTKEDGTTETKEEPTYYTNRKESQPIPVRGDMEPATIPNLVPDSFIPYTAADKKIKDEYKDAEIYKVVATGGQALYLQQTEAGKKALSSITDLYVKQDDGTVKAAPKDMFKATTDGYWILKNESDASNLIVKSNVQDSESYSLHGAMSNKSVNGNGVYRFSDLDDAGIDEETVAAYKQAIANSGLVSADGKTYSWQDFDVVINGDGKNVSFVLHEDLTDGNSNCELFEYKPNAEIDVRTTIDDCLLTFDASNGRITSISYPVVQDDGTITYTNIKLSATVETDDVAYKEAYSKYEYDKTLYDKEQNEINKKTSVIQAEDKSLELKLTRLDNERNAVKTEMDAVKKVIDENIEKSYKTFSG